MQADLPTILGLTADQWTVVTAVSNVALTFGLLWFARRQWQVTNVQAELQDKSEQVRAKERADDLALQRAGEERSLDRDFQLVWAEQFRLEGLADDLDTADLVEQAGLRVLQRDDLLGPRAADVLAALSRLGVEAGFLGGVAQSLSHDAALALARLQGLVDGYATMYPGKGPSEITVLVRQNRGRECKDLEQEIRAKTRDLSLLLWDAVSHSPRANVYREMHFSDNMTSQIGPAAVGALVKRMNETSSARRFS